MSTKENERKEILFPYYINQSRLLDIYSILNGGYSEYEEITTNVVSEKNKSGKAELSISGGFKLFNIGGQASAEVCDKDGTSNENREKKVQTVTSILSTVIRMFTKEGYIKDIKEANTGNFVCLPVNLQINSIKYLFSEFSTLIKLMDEMRKINIDIGISSKEIKEFDKFMKTFQIMFEGEEIIYEENNFAIVGNIIDTNLYQAVRSDLIDTELKCFAQIKRVFPEGTELMKNTIFSKIMDADAKISLIDTMRDIACSNDFSFEATAVPSIKGKPVYQLEIIALYQ